MSSLNIQQLINEVKTAPCKDFNGVYFDIHKELYENGERINSRNGATTEFLNFSTRISDPYKRCVGGYKRNINIFFLIAEAAWIFAGRRDVEFLDIFNSNLKNYSDDGCFYNAPYGWRIRKFGASSMFHFDETNLYALNDIVDQLKINVIGLAKNPEDRRAVISIWNPDLDLGKNSKDLACNCMLMMKIRNGSLHLTVSNRSNDLDWGLLTNVFQFSFLGEAIANMLDVNYGTQVHNSQSLHLYLQNPLTTFIQTEQTFDTVGYDLYSHVKDLKFNFQFEDPFHLQQVNDDQIESVINSRFLQTDMIMKKFVMDLTKCKKLLMNIENQVKKEEYHDFVKDCVRDLSKFDRCLAAYFRLASIYIEYKLKCLTTHSAIIEIFNYAKNENICDVDFIVLALNFFMLRLTNKNSDLAERTYKMMCASHKNYKNIPLGKL